MGLEYTNFFLTRDVLQPHAATATSAAVIASEGLGGLGSAASRSTDESSAMHKAKQQIPCRPAHELSPVTFASTWGRCTGVVKRGRLGRL